VYSKIIGYFKTYCTLLEKALYCNISCKKKTTAGSDGFRKSYRKAEIVLTVERT
jgi:hypothetical protein